MHIIKLFWDIPVALLLFLGVLLVPENNLTGDLQRALHLMGIMAIAVSLTFAGYQRWSRYALSRNHPVADMVLNGVMMASPFLAIFVNTFFLPVTIGLHILSQWRSPDDEKISVKRLIHHGCQLVVFAIGVIVYLNR